MKKFLLLIVVFLLTGCSSYNITMEINKNKSMDFSVAILSRDSNIDFSSSISSYKDKLENNGYSVSEYNDDSLYGFIISKHFDNIDYISKGKRNEEFNLLSFYNNDYSSDIESKMFNVDKSFVSNRYAANFYVDLSELGIDINDAVITYKLFVPNGTETNNAHSVSPDGNELTWNITSLAKTEIDFVFSLKSYDYIYYGVGILIIIFLIFSIVSNLFSKSGDNNSNIIEVESNKNNYDVDKKIENLTKNSVKNIGSNYNNVVNGEFNNNVVYPQRNNINNNSFGSNVVNMDNIKKNTAVEKRSNKTDNVNILVPEVGMSNSRIQAKDKKKLLFGKKNNVSKSDDGSDITVNPNVNYESSFSHIVNSISNNNQIGNSTINVNSQTTQIEKKDNTLNFDENYNIPVLGGEYVNDENNLVSENVGIEHEETKVNQNIDINNVSSNSSSVDSFQYYDEGTTSGVGEEQLEIKDSDEVVINVNNSSFVVENNSKKDL